MANRTKNTLKAGFSGIETDLDKRPTFWQIFALVALVLIIIAGITIIAIIYLKGLAIGLLGMTGLGKKAYQALTKWLKPRSP